MTKRHLELPTGTQETIDQVIGDIDSKLASEQDTAVVVQEVLADLFGDWDAYQRHRAGESLPPLTRARIEGYNPENVFLESERWAEQDHAKLQQAKCLQYLWRGFDLSPVSNNIACRFARMSEALQACRRRCLMMDRRAYLAGVGAVVQTALVGCSSSAGDGATKSTPEPTGYYPGIGDTFQSVTGIEVTVDELHLAASVSFENKTKATTPEDELFVLIHLVAINTSEEPESLPPARNFTLVSDGNRFDPLRGSTDPFERLISPVEGGPYRGLVDAGPQASQEGWIRYQIPRDRSRVTISLSAGGIEAFWRTEIDPGTVQQADRLRGDTLRIGR